MRRLLAFSGLLVAACVACDPDFQLHVHSTVTDGRGPASGLWVFSLAGGRGNECTMRTGADGRADFDIVLFLQKPDFVPIVVARDADAVFVALPGRDFRAKERFFSSTESDATLDVNFPTPHHDLTLDCSATPCVVTGPPVEACNLYELHVDATHASARYAGTLNDPATKDDPARGICTFKPESTGPDLAVVEISNVGALHALTSNAWRPRKTGP